MGTNAVHELLDQHDVAYEVHEHPRAVDASRLAQSEDVTGWDVAKPVLLAIGGELAMAVVPAPVHVDLGKASDVLGHSEVRLATEDEFISRFPDCEPGAEPPFGLLYDVPTYVEAGVADLGVVGFDVLREREPDVLQPLDLGMGRCRLAVAAPGYTGLPHAPEQVTRRGAVDLRVVCRNPVLHHPELLDGLGGGARGVRG